MCRKFAKVCRKAATRPANNVRNPSVSILEGCPRWAALFHGRGMPALAARGGQAWAMPQQCQGHGLAGRMVPVRGNPLS